jgi:uncharacterized protein (TIGR00251 family)
MRRMKVKVRLRPGAKTEKIERVSDAEYRVWVKAPPREGKANAALIEALARYFDRPKSAVHLVSGRTSRDKWIEIDQ